MMQGALSMAAAQPEGWQLIMAPDARSRSSGNGGKGVNGAQAGPCGARCPH